MNATVDSAFFHPLTFVDMQPSLSQLAGRRRQIDVNASISAAGEIHRVLSARLGDAIGLILLAGGQQFIMRLHDEEVQRICEHTHAFDILSRDGMKSDARQPSVRTVKTTTGRSAEDIAP